MRAFFTALFLLASPASAECVGKNLFDTMPPARRAMIDAATAAVPFPTGNYWTATKGDAKVTLIGTYHLNDPRHDQIMAAVGPMVDAARLVLVEGGPDEEQAMKDRLAREPSLMILQGKTLPELLPPEDWAVLSESMRKRGVPPFMAAKFQPWFIAVSLAMPTCATLTADPTNGLDHRIIARAASAKVPLRALEPYDTLFGIFGAISLDVQLSMIRSSLALEDRAQDYSITLSDAYFNGDSRLIWELMRAETADLPDYTPERTEAEFAIMEEALMGARNRAWIPVIEQAANDGTVLAAFGALHLPGKDGVLALMQRAGWTITPLTLTP